MRIIGGRLKGKRILAPSNLPARPTTDFAREGLFNILENEIDWPETSVLDLFAGIGGLTFEAASRGAMKVVSVEQHFATTRHIKKTAIDLGLGHVTCVKSEAMKFLAQQQPSFQLVLADPPYEYPDYNALIQLCLEKATAANGILVVEHSKKHNFDGLPMFVRHRKYGEVNFSFFEKQQT